MRKLQEQAIALPATLINRQVSALDGTEKYLFSMQDGHSVGEC